MFHFMTADETPDIYQYFEEFSCCVSSPEANDVDREVLRRPPEWSGVPSLLSCFRVLWVLMYPVELDSPSENLSLCRLKDFVGLVMQHLH